MSNIGFIGLTDVEKRKYVASLLNCNPAEPGSWPKDMIDKILTEASVAALNRVCDLVRRGF